MVTPGDESAFDTNRDLGYWLDPSDATALTGHHALRVWIRGAPTYRHYDPEQVECHVVNYNGSELLTIHHPWMRQRDFRFCVGGITLNDRKHRLVHFYAFGGELTIAATDEPATLCSFASPAPILALSDHNPLVNIFVDEVEATLAEERAAWNVQHRPGDFADRLCASNPLALYCYFLAAAARHLRPIHGDVTVAEHRLVHFAESELARLAHEEPCRAAQGTLVSLFEAGAGQT